MFEFMFWFGVSFVVLSILMGQFVSSSCCYVGGGFFGLTYLFQPLPVLLFVMLTGGAGILITAHLIWLHPGFIGVLAVATGLSLAYVLSRWVFAPIYLLEHTSSTTNLGLYGVSFVLERELLPGATISHGLLMDTTYQNRLIALYHPELPLPKGTTVYVLSIQNNVLYVGTHP